MYPRVPVNGLHVKKARITVVLLDIGRHVSLGEGLLWLLCLILPNRCFTVATLVRGISGHLSSLICSLDLSPPNLYFYSTSFPNICGKSSICHDIRQGRTLYRFCVFVELHHLKVTAFLPAFSQVWFLMDSPVGLQTTVMAES